MPSRTRALNAPCIAYLLVASSLVAAQPALAVDPVSPADYPELAPEALLPPILAALRHTLPDIYSVREMRMCPVRHLKLKDGQPNDWDVRFEYNAKNENGGYSGIRRDAAIFRDRRIAYQIGRAPQLGREGLDGIFSGMVDKQMAECSPISDAAIQQALAAAK